MVNFKLLEQNDIETILSMMQDFYTIDNYPIDTNVSKKLFQEFIDDEKLGKAWLIKTNDKIVGYAILTFIFSFEYKGTIAFLDELYISEKVRGKGIGKKTIDFVQAEAKKQHVKVVYLEVENHNENAQKLYLANDFIVHHRKLMKYSVK